MVVTVGDAGTVTGTLELDRIGFLFGAVSDLLVALVVLLLLLFRLDDLVVRDLDLDLKLYWCVELILL